MDSLHLIQNSNWKKKFKKQYCELIFIIHHKQTATSIIILSIEDFYASTFGNDQDIHDPFSKIFQVILIKVRDISKRKLSVRRYNAAKVRICNILVMILGLVSIVTVFGVPGCITWQ